MLGFILKIIGYAALGCFLGFMLWAMWRAVTKPGKNGSLPWF